MPVADCSRCTIEEQEEASVSLKKLFSPVRVGRTHNKQKRGNQLRAVDGDKCIESTGGGFRDPTG